MEGGRFFERRTHPHVRSHFAAIRVKAVSRRWLRESKKVYANAGLFALKEITNAKEMAAVQQSYMLYGKQMIPLYLSRQGLPFVRMAGIII